MAVAQSSLIALQGSTPTESSQSAKFTELKYAFCYDLTHRQAVIKTIIAIRKFP
jgi:hypothetical protein